MKITIDMDKIGPRMNCPTCNSVIKSVQHEDGNIVHFCECAGDDGIWHWVIRKNPKTSMAEYRY